MPAATPGRSRDRRRRWILAVAYTALLASCDNPLAPEVEAVTRVEIAPPVLQLVVGGTASLVARVYGTGGALLPGAKVFWSSQSPGVVTVNQSGGVTAVAAGTAQIAASSGGQSRTIAVTVEQRPIALVRVTPSAGSVVVGQSLPLQGEALDGTGGILPNRPLAWSSDSPAIATVDNNGVVTGVAVGLATISATGEGKTGSAVVTVLPPSVASISVSPDGGTVAAGNTLQLFATARDAGGQPLADRPLTWQSNNDGVATVSSNGLVTAITPGAVAITVSAPGAGPGGTTPSTSVDVLVQPRPVASAVIVPSPASVQVGGVITLTVNLFDAGSEPLSPVGRTITWATSNAAVATVSGSGSATGVAVGTATITASIVTPGQPNTVQATVALSVSNQPVVAVVVTPDPATVHAGALYARPFSAVALDGANQPLPGRTIVWTSSNQAIARVDAGTGVVTGVAPGTVQIRATSEGIEGVSSVTVDLVPVSAVTVAPAAVTMTPGQEQPLVATPRDSAGNAIAGSALGGRGTTWASSDAAVATVSVAGVVSAVAQGTSTVTATIGGTGGQSSITVNSIPIASIVVAPSPQLLTLGTSVVMTATAQDALGGLLPGRVFTWASDNPLVATVDQAGLVTTVAVGGPVSITATAEGKVGTALVTVIPRPASKLGMSTQPASVAQSGVAIAQQPAVQLLDDINVPVPQAGVVVTAALGSGTGTLGGTLTATTDAAGIATFTDLAITGPAGPYTLAFSAPSLAGVVSGSVILGAGGASQLAVTTQPSPAAVNAVALAQQPAVTLLDGSSNPVALAGVVVTASIATGSGSLGGTLVATTDAAGVATFTDLSITGLAGAFTLRFAAPGLTDAISGTVTLSPGAAAARAMAAQPSATATNGAPFAAQPAVRVTDSGGNPVAAAGVTVTAALASGAATLGGTVAVLTDAAGVATFTDLAITGLAGSYPLDFSAPGLTPVSSTPVGVGAGAATQLALTTQPSAAPQNAIAFPVQPVIQLRDASGNPVAQAGVVVGVALSAGGTGTLGGTLTATTDAAGAATFTGLSITGVTGIRTLDFTSPPLAGVTSANVDVQPGVPTQLALTTPPPGTATSGEVFTSPTVVQLRDVSGNDVPQAGVQVTAAIATGSGATLGGTLATTDAAGAATFSTLTLTGTAGTFTLSFSSGALAPVTSGAVALSAGTGSKLAVIQQPSASVQNAIAFPVQPAIQLQDASSNPVMQAGVQVFANIAGGGGSLGGTTSAFTDASGLATFTNLSITGTAGDRTLLFSASGYLPVSSGTITVTAGLPTSVTINQQPSAAAQSGIAFTTQPIILVRDISSNPVSGVTVTAALASGASALGGTLGVVTDASGLATYTDLVITGPVGSRTISFTVPGPVTATSGTISVGAGTPTGLTITTQPSSPVANDVVFPQQPVVHLQDGAGNPVSGVLVTASIATGGGTLGGTTTATTDGLGNAAFSGLKITGTVGDRTLDFSGATLSNPSNTVSVTVGAATSLAITQQPGSPAVNDLPLSPQPSVQLTDVSGNPLVGVVVTASIASGGGTLGGTTTATTDAAGVATWTNLRITGTIGDRALAFSAASLTTNSGTVTVTPGAATQLALTTAPGGTAANGALLSPQPVVRLRDVSGNDVLANGTPITAALASGAGTLGGTLAVNTDANGVSAFTDLAITGVTGDRTISFTSPGLASATSGTISITPGPPALLTVTGQPSPSAVNDVAFAAQPLIQVNDGSGNPVPGVVVTASIATGAGTLGGTLTATTDALGTAAFTDLKITGVVGDRTLGFAAGLLSGTSNTVGVTAGNATSLSVTLQPDATVQNDAVFTTQPQVTLTDVSGNPVPGVTVTAAIASGGGTLGGTLTAATDVLGVATFSGLKITGLTGIRTLGFTAGALSAPSTNITVTPGAVTQLALLQGPPSTAPNGTTLQPDLTVQLRDISGNDVPTAGTPVTAAIASGAGVLGGTLTVNTNGSGLSTFSDLAITGLVGDRTLSFTIAGPISVTSGIITITPGTPTAMTMAVQPSATVANDAVLPVQPSIQVSDGSGNGVAGVVVTASIASGGGTLGGTLTATTNAAGTATFTGLTITGLTGDRTLGFAGASLTATSGTISVTFGAAHHFTLEQGPSGTAVNDVAFAQQPVIQVRDISGNAVAQSNIGVTATIASGGGTLGGTVTVNTDGTGLATFGDLKITGLIGDRTLDFTSPGIAPLPSGTITISAGTATQLSITVQPSSTAATGVPLTQQPVIQLLDVSGNLVSQGGVTVTVTLASGTGTLGGTVSVDTDGSGVASWAISNDLAITGSGSHTLQFSAGALTPAVSTAIVLP